MGTLSTTQSLETEPCSMPTGISTLVSGPTRGRRRTACTCTQWAYTHSNGDLYEGEFETQSYSNGKYVWACGKTYEGRFKNGKPDGHGTMEHQIKDWKYIGEFKGGKFHGTGAFYWSKLNYYEGTFE